MAIYTGTADANGNFSIPFGISYTSGEKVTVIAEKDGATKSIELYAPSDTAGGGAIQFSGTLVDFPANIGVMTLSGLSGAIKYGAFKFTDAVNDGMSAYATGLIIEDGVTTIESYAFSNFRKVVTLSLPSTLTSIGNYTFESYAACNTIICKAAVPPTITTSSFQNLKSTCVFKVPAASVAAYQAAPNWSAFASRIQAI